MRTPSFYTTTTVTVAIALIIISTAILGYLSFYYKVGEENLIDASLVQSNIRLATQYMDRIEQKIIDNDRILSNMVDIDDRAGWPALVEEIKDSEYNVEEVYFLPTTSNYPLYPSYSYEISKSWDAFRNSFRLSEINLGRLNVGETHHLHKERPGSYFFASYVLKENSEGEKILICFQMDYEKILELIDSYLRDLQPNFYVGIVDFNNRVIYRESIGRDSKYFYETRFPTTLYKWLLQVVPRNYPEIERQAANQRRTYSFLIILSITLIFCSLAIIHVASRRERQLTQLKEDFINHVSHELKTPLSLIRMFSEMLVTDRVQGNNTKQDYYRIIHNESDRMSHLVNNLLDFSRMDRDGQGANFEPTDIGRLVARSVEAYRHQMQKDGFLLRADIDEGLPQLMADPNALTTAIFNLLDNSLKYSGDPKEVTVSVSPVDGFVDLSVADRGPGIPMSEQKKVFENFYRCRSAQSRNVRGSGIGLSIVKQVAELHGGEVTVKSSPGEGSTFTLSLPVSPREEQK